MTLTQNQTDAIADVLRTGVDRAASSLIDLVCDEVSVNVPSIVVMPIRDVGAWMRANSPPFAPAVVLQFHGLVHGHLALLLPVSSASKLASSLGVEPNAAGLQEVVVETGNILLNAVAGSMANCLGCDLSFDTPHYTTAPALMAQIGLAQAPDGKVLLARTCFELAESTIEGQILLHLNKTSTEALVAALETVAATR